MYARKDTLRVLHLLLLLRIHLNGATRTNEDDRNTPKQQHAKQAGAHCYHSCCYSI